MNIHNSYTFTSIYMKEFSEKSHFRYYFPLEYFFGGVMSTPKNHRYCTDQWKHDKHNNIFPCFCFSLLSLRSWKGLAKKSVGSQTHPSGKICQPSLLGSVVCSQGECPCILQSNSYSGFWRINTSVIQYN